MDRWQRALLAAAARAESRVDDVVLRHRRTRGFGRLVVVPYRGYGTDSWVRVSGRVLREPRVLPGHDRQPAWRNLLDAWRRFESDEVPGAKLRASLGDASAEVEADGEGYFHLRLALPPGPPGEPSPRWRGIELKLLDPAPATDAPAVTAHALVPPATSRIAVVSDIDDTVLVTGVTERLRMLRRTLLENAAMRLPMPGIPALYQALVAGATGAEGNPVFYVSSSPWNLYDLLGAFLELRGLPQGPVFLKDLGLGSEALLGAGHRDHKLAWLNTLLDTYPDLPFLLFGDSGQLDPEIYLSAARLHPGRIKAVYVRDVTGAARDRAVARIADEAAAAGTELVYAESTEAMASHAAERGFIAGAAAAAVAGAAGADAGASGAA